MNPYFNNLDMIFFTISLVTVRSELFFISHNIILRMGLPTSCCLGKELKLLPWRRRRTLGNCIRENSRNYAYPKSEFDHSLNTDNNIIILRISILFSEHPLLICLPISNVEHNIFLWFQHLKNVQICTTVYHKDVFQLDD